MFKVAKNAIFDTFHLILFKILNARQILSTIYSAWKNLRETYYCTSER